MIGCDRFFGRALQRILDWLQHRFRGRRASGAARGSDAVRLAGLAGLAPAAQQALWDGAGGDGGDGVDGVDGVRVGVVAVRLGGLDPNGSPSTGQWPPYRMCGSRQELLKEGESGPWGLP